MTITLTIPDLLLCASIVVPIGSAALYWAVRMAIRSAVQEVRYEALERYQTRAECDRIRAECERHRHEALGLTNTRR